MTPFIKVAKFDDLQTLIGSAVTFSAEYVYCGLKCLVIVAVIYC